MKFTLEIELGNDAMQSAEDVFDAIEHCGDTNPTPFQGGESNIIRDLNGNKVGKWEVTQDAPAAITAPPRSASAFIAECDHRKKKGIPPPAPNDPYWNK